MTVRDWLREAQGRLAAQGIAVSNLEAQLLATHVLRVDRPWLFAHAEEEFPELAGESLLQRREAGEPVAYILGWREFYGRRFSVDHRVLIPRQETETLVDSALELGPKNARVLDLGTGSGILGITLKLEKPAWEVTAVDISSEALEVAKSNASDLGAAVRFLHSDAFQELLGESFDLIVTNPPYVGRHEPLAREVEAFEPHLALYGGESGYEFLKRLAREARAHLTDGGLLLTEVGYRQGQAARDIFEGEGWRCHDVRKDLSGHERVVVVQPFFECQV